MKPSIGRIVHYVTPSGTHLPAIIVRVAPCSVAVRVFQSEPLEYLGDLTTVRFDETLTRETWHWPEREN